MRPVFARIACLFAFVCVLAYPAEAQRPGERQPRAEPRYDFYSHGPYRAGIPKPSAILGYEAGDTHTTFRDQERVLFAIANAAKDRVKIVDYGKSVEGRPLRLAIVSAPENLAKLEAIRAAIGKLADPRKLTGSAESDKIIQNTPCLTWINHCVHGNETASFETVMWTLYTLAASEAPDIKEALQKSVVILNPIFNPDGHERFVVYFNSVALGHPDYWAYEQGTPWAMAGRFNHYRFDMNRDKLAMSQPEIRQETAAYLRWFPQVFADEHGQVENYFFPPNSQSINRQAGRERIEKWTDILGRGNAAAFDKFGWQYMTRESYDFFAQGYLDTFASLSGAIGMTYETDGGGDLAHRRDDDTVTTLRDGAARHLEASLATIRTAARNREALLRDFLAYRRGAIEAGKTDKMKRIVLLPGSDPGRASELAALLRRAGVEVQEARTPFRSASAHAYLSKAGEGAKAQEFPAGALIVDLAQPQGWLARAYLEPDPDFEPEFLRAQQEKRARNEKKNENESKEGYDFYDFTAWSLPFAYDLEAYWLEDRPDVDVRPLEPDAQDKVALQTLTGGIRGGKPAVAYAFRYDRDAAAFLALRLLQEDFILHAAIRPVRADGKDWPRGTIIARVSRNPESLPARLETLARELGVEVYAIKSNYSDTSPFGINTSAVVSLKKPNIAVIADDNVFQTSFGAVWYLFERQAGLRFTPVRLNRLNADTLARFNVIVMPDGYNYAGTLGKGRIDSLKEWISQGGTLVGLSGGGLWFTDKEVGLSTATAVGSDARPDEKPMEPKPGEKSMPGKPIDLPGAIFRATVDPTHFLGFGYEKGEIAVPLSGSTFLKPSAKGSNVVSFGKGPSRLSGFIWPDNTEELLANTAYVIDEPLGRGHAILYLSDPTFRALFAGQRRLFLSSILFGPSRAPFTNGR